MNISITGNAQKDKRPIVLPLLVLREPLFPGMTFGIDTTPHDTDIIKLCLQKYDGKIFIVIPMKSAEDSTHPNRHTFYTMGTVGEILHHKGITTTSIECSIGIIERARCTSIQDVDNILLAQLEYPEEILPTTKYEEQEADVLAESIRTDLIYLSALRPDKNELPNLKEMPQGRLAEFAINYAHGTPDELQAALETLRVRERLESAQYILRREIKKIEWKLDIRQKVEETIEKRNRTYALHEQLKEIKAALGEDLDSKEEDLDKLNSRLEEIKDALSPEAMEKISDEMSRLKTANSQSPDYAISKNYLDWLTRLPWKNRTDDILDVTHTRAILDRDHYGLEDVKKRILEFVSVAKLKGSMQGSILCLIGPPGVGKTSLGRSIAEALGRKFFRFSLGGMHDEAEIKGHRRTYIGAQPGKIISALKTCETKNPVIMLDEIDKLDSSHRGDPASALLEVLDPEQNSTFRDHFLDVPFDLSQVLFIATANVRDTIPAPLLDRMEIIQLSGYITEEKINIAQRHLIPKQLEKNGLKENQIAFSTPAVRALIDGYARDSGVRALEKAIGNCMRKVAVKIAEKSHPADKTFKVKPATLEEFLGKKIFYDDPLLKNPQPGVAMGLAWTAMGGTTLYIETIAINGEPGLKLTGQLGDVMKESSQIALSLVEARTSQFGIDKSFFKKHKIHIHVPAGAVPKDGPSAGITLASSIISAATGKALPPRWAMTGELTLTSRVLPVGGIKEKMISAKRAGVTNVILPEENKKDFLEITEQARAGLTAHFVSKYDQVFQLLFPG